MTSALIILAVWMLAAVTVLALWNLAKRHYQ